MRLCSRPVSHLYQAVDDGVNAAQRLCAILGKDQKTVVEHPSATVMAV